jgi:hypothetical protein
LAETESLPRNRYFPREVFFVGFGFAAVSFPSAAARFCCFFVATESPRLDRPQSHRCYRAGEHDRSAANRRIPLGGPGRCAGPTNHAVLRRSAQSTNVSTYRESAAVPVASKQRTLTVSSPPLQPQFAILQRVVEPDGLYAVTSGWPRVVPRPGNVTW